MNLEEIERGIKALEDIEEIKGLKARYCDSCDIKADPNGVYDPDSVAELFTEDGVYDVGRLGTFSDREEISRLFTDMAPRRNAFSVHMVTNPIIKVDGDKAEGTWYLLQTFTYVEGNEAGWHLARYDEQYARVDGQWKFKHMKLTPFFRTPFDQGWVKNRFRKESIVDG